MNIEDISSQGVNTKRNIFLESGRSSQASIDVNPKNTRSHSSSQKKYDDDHPFSKDLERFRHRFKKAFQKKLNKHVV